MQLNNDTPFSPFNFEAYAQRNGSLNVVVCRGTFDLRADGELSIAAEQQPVVLADRHLTKPLVSSVQVDTDLVPHKFAADIILNAMAQAPHGQSATTLPVAVRVGKLSRSLRVTGPHCWQYSLLTGWQLTRPEQTLSVPIEDEYAFGKTKVHCEPAEIVFEQFPIGCGLPIPVKPTDNKQSSLSRSKLRASQQLLTDNAESNMLNRHRSHQTHGTDVHLR